MNTLQAFGYIAAQATRGDISLPTSVNAVLRLKNALDQPGCHLDDAIRLVLGEPQLAARTVALANSAAFNSSGNAITGVRAAVHRIGYRHLQTLVASLLVRQFGVHISDPALRAKAEQLWQHTAHVAALAQVLARRVTGVDPDTAVFAAIVHEVGGFYLLTRAGEFPGLLDARSDPEDWATLCEEVVSREILRKLGVPQEVADAIGALRASMLGMPPCSLLDTLLLANQYAPVPSPLDKCACHAPRDVDTLTDLVFDDGMLAAIQIEAEEAYRSMSAALLA